MHMAGQYLRLLCMWYIISYMHTSGIYAFVIEKDGVTDSEEEVIQHLKQLIRKQIGGFAVPEAFLVRAYYMYLVLTTAKFKLQQFQNNCYWTCMCQI